MPKNSEKPVLVWFRESTCDHVFDRKMNYLSPDPRYQVRYNQSQINRFVRALMYHGEPHPALVVKKRRVVAGLWLVEGARALARRTYPAIEIEHLNKHELQRWVNTTINLARRVVSEHVV